MKSLADIAKTQPHAAYSAFIHGEQHKYTYFLRTIAGISENLKPLDEVIENVTFTIGPDGPLGPTTCTKVKNKSLS